MKNNGKLTIIGVGNPYRGDDAVGIHIAHELINRIHNDIDIMINYGEVAAMMETFEKSDSVILVDAMCSGSEPGTVIRLDASRDEIPAESFSYSTHAFSIPEAVGLARVLGRLPRNVIVYGIEGKVFETGKGLSTEVEKAAGNVVCELLRDIARMVIPNANPDHIDIGE